MALITSDSPLFQRGEKVAPVEELRIDENDTETRFLPRSVQLVLPGHVVRKLPAGLQEVPRALLDHPWLLANGMVDYRATQGVPPPAQPMAPVGSHAYATAFMASGTYDATQIPDPYVTDEVLSGATANVQASLQNVRAAQEQLDEALRVHNAAVAALSDAQVTRARADDEGRAASDADTRLTGGSSQPTRAQRRAIAKQNRGVPDEDRAANEARLGLDKLSASDRALFDAMQPGDKSKFIQSSEEDRENMLAALRR